MSIPDWIFWWIGFIAILILALSALCGCAMYATYKILDMTRTMIWAARLAINWNQFVEWHQHNGSSDGLRFKVKKRRSTSR